MLKRLLMFLAIILISLSLPVICFGLDIKSQFIPGLNTINDAAYIGGFYLEACNSGQIRYSKDMSTWKYVKISNFDLVNINYVNNTYIALDKSNSVYISSDCINWIKQEHFDVTVNKMLYINKAVYLIGNKGFMAKSTNGKVWTSSSSLSSVDIKDMVFNGRTYTLIGNYNKSAFPYVVIYYSKDLKTWKQAYHGKYYASDIVWRGLGLKKTDNSLIAYYNENTGSKQSYSETYYLLKSKDGIKWETIKYQNNGSILDVCTYDSGFITLTNSNMQYGPDYPGASQNINLYDKNYKMINSINTKRAQFKKVGILNNKIVLYGRQSSFEIFKNFNSIDNTKFKKELFYFGYNSAALYDQANSRYLLCEANGISAVYLDGRVEILYESLNGSIYGLTKAGDRFIAFEPVNDQNTDNKSNLIKTVGNLDIYKAHYGEVSSQIVYDTVNKRLVKYSPGYKKSDGINEFMYEFDYNTGDWKSMKLKIDSIKIGSYDGSDDIQIKLNESEIKQFFTSGKFSYVNNKFFITTPYGSLYSEDCTHWKINVSTEIQVMGNELQRFGQPIAYDEINNVYLSLFANNFISKKPSNGMITFSGSLSEDAFSFKSSIQVGFGLSFKVIKPGYSFNSDIVEYAYLLNDHNFFITRYGNIEITTKNYFNSEPYDDYAGKQILNAYNNGDSIILLTEDFELVTLK